MLQTESPAVAIAQAHVDAWSNHDFETARTMLAPDVKVLATSTSPALPRTELTGADDYMAGLIAYAEPIVAGSVRVLSSVGDEHNALLTLSIKIAGGPFGGGAEAPCARLYLVDGDGKIQVEHVVFFVGAS